MVGIGSLGVGMNLYKNKVFRLAYKAYRDFSRYHIIMPRQIRIEGTKLCNLRCVGCRRHLDGNMSKLSGDKHLTLERLKVICGMLPTLKVVLFAGDGEPTVNPYLKDLLRYLERSDIRPTITTNGTFGDSELVQVLEECDTFRVSMSMTGATKETFEELRTGAKLDVFLGNLEALCKTSIPIYLNYLLLNQQTLDEIPELVRIGVEAGVTGFSFMKPYVSDSTFVPPDYVNMKGQLEEIGTRIEETGLKWEGNLNPGPTFRRCYDPFVQPYVTLNGDVFGCQYLANQRTEEWYMGEVVKLDSKNFIMGNIFEDSLEDIWYNDAYKELRAYMRRTARPVGAEISREKLLEMELNPDKDERFAYCKGCLYRWREAGS